MPNKLATTYPIHPPEEALALYLHWPFCAHKCPYCDFNVHIAKTPIDNNIWQQAFINQINHYYQLWPNRRITSIFFGGGTPSMMVPRLLEAIIDTISDRWSISDPKNTKLPVEITLEANPEDCSIERLRDWRCAGITRLSIGIQSLDNARLHFLGRNHNGNQSRQAIINARQEFANVSVDMIYATPDQSLSQWEAELTEILTIVGDHMSCYHLTIEKGTPFHADWRSRRLTPISDDRAADLYTLTEERLALASFHHYEVSNYALNHTYSHHNLNYWHGGDYLGLGPGGHSRITDGNQCWSIEQERHPRRWLSQCPGKNFPLPQLIDQMNRATERLMMGLRLDWGINYLAFRQRYGLSLHDLINKSALNEGIAQGWLTSDQHNLRATDHGRLRLNALLSYLLA